MKNILYIFLIFSFSFTIISCAKKSGGGSGSSSSDTNGSGGGSSYSSSCNNSKAFVIGNAVTEKSCHPNCPKNKAVLWDLDKCMTVVGESYGVVDATGHNGSIYIADDGGFYWIVGAGNSIEKHQLNYSGYKLSEVTGIDVNSNGDVYVAGMVQKNKKEYTAYWKNGELVKWFRYEINAFVQTVDNFEVMFDGKMQPINFSESPVFRQIIVDAKAKPEPESLPPVRVGGCLIATASYGSELAPQVQQLRELRDNTILQTESGAAFMTGFNQFYYSFSPMIADYERENPAFKEAVKLTLTPLLASLTLLQYVDIDSESEMLGYGIAVILLNIGMYFIAPAVLITKIRSFYKLQ